MDDTTKQKLAALKPLFDNAKAGDFSKDVPDLQPDDELTETYAGIQAMINVIREKSKALESKIKEVQSLDHAKTEFVSLASHQMRAPLTTINLFSEMLLKQNMEGLNPEQKKYIEEMHKASKRMVTLSNDLINISTLEMHTFIPRMQTFSLSEFAESILKSLEPDINAKHLQVTKKFGENMPQITVGSQFIKLIMVNLLTNAVKYTPENGTISLEIAFNDPLKQFTINVSDTGYGIPDSEQQQMFGMFFRASNIREKVPDGNGLGLRIVKLILDGINGSISFSSKEHAGSTFTVILPQTAALNS